MIESKASVEIKVPVHKCYQFVKDSITNPKFLSAYNILHSGKNYSGKIIDDIKNHRIVLEECAIDCLTGIRRTGWAIKYDFEEIDDQNTRITISIQYGALLAITSMATVKIQSFNEILSRINTLLALEY